MRYWPLFAVGTALAGIVAACGSDGDGSLFGNGDNEAGVEGGDLGDGSGPMLGGGKEGGGSLGSGMCIPRTCAELAANCGPIGNGCGGSIKNCGDCKAPEFCGGGGKASVCGGASTCVPATCATAKANCGPIGDGCGGLIADCGSCKAPAICGGGGKPSVCGGDDNTGDGGSCMPITTCPAGACGPIANGCGGILACGTCTAPQICGGAGVASQCGGNNGCVPKTTCPVGSCGPVADGCGGLIAGCNNACSGGEICGGGGVASVCGGSDAGVDAGPCTGLCLQQVKCDGGGTTTLTGTVYAPNGTEPLPNAVVYVPNSPVLPFTTGVACNQCGADISGSPLVKSFTGFDGKFTLTNVPVGANIPLVVQIGRWRRQIVVPTVASCVNTPVAATLTRLPKNKGEGDIPLTAIATGNVDSLECVIRKIGVDDAEFTSPGGTGRIQMYVANGATSSTNNAPSWTGGTGLIDSLATLEKYDLVLLACEGFADYAVVNATTPPNPTGVSARQQAMIDYTNAGGRLYATHYNYTWLANGNNGVPPANAGPSPFSSTASFKLDQASTSPVTGDIDTSFPKGLVFAEWLGQPAVNALSNVSPPKISINQSRHDMTSVVAPSQSWITVDATPASGYTGVTQHYTFNTPTTVPAASQCGRVLYSDFHVSDAVTGGVTFPKECNPVTPPGPLTPQEKVLEFMLFDLANCITPDKPPSCTSKTCAQQGANCGPVGDGCGNVIQCGNCAAGQSCGAGGPSQCGGPICTPKTCAGLGFNCGQAPDGCGGVLSCGTCAKGMNCGAMGPNTCGVPTCTKTTCAAQGLGCGPAGDGCGGMLDCGPCTAPQTCGGGGTPNQCGAPACTKQTCASAGVKCGPLADGCGGLLQCGTCVAPDTCGGGGTPNVCGGGPK